MTSGHGRPGCGSRGETHENERAGDRQHGASRVDDEHVAGSARGGSGGRRRHARGGTSDDGDGEIAARVLAKHRPFDARALEEPKPSEVSGGDAPPASGPHSSFGSDDGSRTRDSQMTSLVLYQLSYIREAVSVPFASPSKRNTPRRCPRDSVARQTGAPLLSSSEGLGSWGGDLCPASSSGEDSGKKNEAVMTTSPRASFR